MNTPIYDFVNKYSKGTPVRMHMPGHKGKGPLGCESIDITEIQGADCLFTPNGIIKESEENATRIFGTGKTVYSCEGSSLSIRTMLHLVRLYRGNGYVLSTRNAHSSFISACALNDLEIKWIYPQDTKSYLSCYLNGEILEKELSCVDKMPLCVYVTSPDYLGNMCDIKSIGDVCKKYDIPLLVDNAHGAYLKFLENDMHPISLGATMCCDSAHKTLPVLTGGGYLHISKDAPSIFQKEVKNAMHLFASTSPSYLILASLDKANEYLSTDYPKELKDFAKELKNTISNFAFCILHSAFSIREPLKIVIETKKIGYRGGDFSKILKESNILCEFCDEDFVVLMLTPQNGISSLEALKTALKSIPKKAEIVDSTIELIPPERVMSVRDAAFSPREQISIDNALGRVLAISNITCPPAVSLIVGGERFNQSIIELCKKYGTTHCYVIAK